jgi:hypothetical protein
MLRSTSRAIASPSAAGCLVRRFHFAFTDAKQLDACRKRREAIADYVASWLDGTIVAERREGLRCTVTVEVARPASVAAAEQFCREAPHYLPRSFAAASGYAAAPRKPTLSISEPPR